MGIQQGIDDRKTRLLCCRCNRLCGGTCCDEMIGLAARMASFWLSWLRALSSEMREGAAIPARLCGSLPLLTGLWAVSRDMLCSTTVVAALVASCSTIRSSGFRCTSSRRSFSILVVEALCTGVTWLSTGIAVFTSPTGGLSSSGSGGDASHRRCCVLDSCVGAVPCNVSSLLALVALRGVGCWLSRAFLCDVTLALAIVALYDLLVLAVTSDVAGLSAVVAGLASLSDGFGAVVRAMFGRLAVVAKGNLAIWAAAGNMTLLAASEAASLE